ncbi:MAG: hypothetical protein LBC88_02880 [Spirochaetaceae bacterium]|nr:hypothetical protein [Spirochaetaceae bacterium]
MRKFSFSRARNAAFFACMAAVFLCGAVSGRGAVFAEENTILAAYKRNFLRASLEGKANMLMDAATDERSAEFAGFLAEFALTFSLENAELLRGDEDFIILTALAAKSAGDGPLLWNVFTVFEDTVIRVEVLAALSRLAVSGEGGVAAGVTSGVGEGLTAFLAEETERFRAGGDIDGITLDAAVRALGGLGGESAVPVLFTMMTAGFPDPIPASAATALAALPAREAYLRRLVDLIENGEGAEKRFAWDLGMKNSAFGDEDRGALAEAALTAALEALQPNDADIRALRYEAVPVLGTTRWVRAAPVALRHFHLVYEDFSRGNVSKIRALQAIRTLGALESADAARTLSLLLARINAAVERAGAWDEEITIALVEALGALGHRSAFDSLTYISYLSYPEPVQYAAREALNRLKW